MALDRLNLVWLKGKSFLADRSPAKRTITLVPSERVVDRVTNEEVFPSVISITSDVGGLFAAQIPATDDPDLEPVGWHYVVTEAVVGAAKSRASFPMEVPYNTPADPNDVEGVDASFGQPVLWMADVVPAVLGAIAHTTASLQDFLDHTANVTDAHDVQARIEVEALARVDADASHAGATDPHAGYRRESAQLVTADYANDSVTGAKADAPSIAAEILLRGTFAGRPAATAANANLYYFASDAPGTLYQSDGAQWVTIVSGAPNAATDAKYVDVTGDTMTGPLANSGRFVSNGNNGGLFGHIADYGSIGQAITLAPGTQRAAILASTLFSVQIRPKPDVLNGLASAPDSRLEISATGVGLNGNAPVAKAAAIASPTADSAALKTAVDAIRAALTNIGITA